MMWPSPCRQSSSCRRLPQDDQVQHLSSPTAATRSARCESGPVNRPPTHRHGVVVRTVDVAQIDRAALAARRIGQPEIAGDRQERGKALGCMAGKIPDHRAALREPGRDDAVLVDRPTLPDIRDDIAQKADIVASLAGGADMRPGSVETVRRDEDGAAAGSGRDQRLISQDIGTALAVAVEIEQQPQPALAVPARRLDGAVCPVRQGLHARLGSRRPGQGGDRETRQRRGPANRRQDHRIRLSRIGYFMLLYWFDCSTILVKLPFDKPSLTRGYSHG